MKQVVRDVRRTPVLLANSNFYGTLAATRSLGESGIPVYIADDDLLGVSRWSRHAARAIRAPSLAEPARFVDWVRGVGESEPGIVLYPTSDEAAYLYALHRDELAKTFRMYSPHVDAILHVLDKKRLYASAKEVGMRVPDTWFPDTEDDVERIAREAPMPVLVKPRTQVLSNTHSKGVVVDQPAELAARYSTFVRSTQYGRELLERFPDAPKAMIQQFVPEAAEQIYVLAAFVDKTGKHFAARSAMKVFQRPRSLGIGLCFEESPLSPKLAELARKLAEACGYYGLFQLEFIKTEDDYLLIDFNPRFYNQLAFDVARGLPLPQIVYSAALGEDAAAAEMVDAAQDQHDSGTRVFCNAFGLRVMLSTQRLAGRMTATEASKWKAWYARHEGGAIDPAIAPGDVLPGVIDVAAQLYAYARHPRAFLRKIVLDRTA